MRRLKCTYLALTVLLVAATSPVAAQQGSVNLHRALDRPIQLQLPDATIAEVFAELEKLTGVKFVVEQDALDCLPYGDQTRLQVTLKNLTLRKALSPMLAQQALRWEVDGDLIRIRPTNALYRLCRRATYDELVLLGKLHSQQLKPTAEGGPVVEQLQKLSGLKELRIRFHLKTDTDAAHKRAERVLPNTPAAYLETLCHGQDWTWVVRGDNIIIVEKLLQVRRQLEQKVSLRYQNSELLTVLLDLARKGRVRLSMAPGVMNYLPASTQRSFNLVMADASIAQALEVISGATGLEFIQTPEGIRVEASESLRSEVQATTQRRRRSARFFVRMTLPGPGGANIEVFMRPEELPPDVLEQIEKAKEQFIRQLRSEPAE